MEILSSSQKTLEVADSKEHCFPPGTVPSILRSLGLFGLDSIEEPVLSGLVTGDPVLLIGGHGTAKTTLVERLAECLAESFHSYDASKVLFEDLIGWPSPHSMASGKVEYIPTPLSIWDKSFVLVDEISRATPSMQNKWLEIIRSRRVMGLKLTDLRYVFAAMNPGAYDGAYQLDPALAGRFGFVITMPEISSMSPQDVRAIAMARHNGDAPALGSTPPVGNSLEIRAMLVTLLSQARDLYREIEMEWGHRISQFLGRLNHSLACRRSELALDGRRLGLMYRGILAVLSLRTALEKRSAADELFKSMENLCSILGFLLPFSATMAQAPDPIAIESAVAWAAKEACDPARMAHVKSGVELVKHVVDTGDGPSLSGDLPKLTEVVLEGLGNPDLEARADAAVALSFLAPLVCEKRDLRIPPSWRARLIRAWRLWTCMPQGILHDNELEEVLREGIRSAGLEGGSAERLALLLALHVSQDHDMPATRHSTINGNKVLDAYTQIRSRFDFLKGRYPAEHDNSILQSSNNNREGAPL